MSNMISHSPRKICARPTTVAYLRGGNTSTRLLKDGSEAVWPEDLQNAMMEALMMYPASESRVKLTDGTSLGRTVVLGRCQLIQQYIKEKTGKIRTRKQVASRLQRMRQLHHNDPRSNDILAVSNPYANILPIVMDLVRSGRLTSRRSDETPEAGSPGGSDANTPTQGAVGVGNPGGFPKDVGQDENTDPNFSTSNLHPASSSSSGELPEKLIQAVELQPRIIVHSTSATDSAHWQSPSMSRRRLASNIPVLQLQVELPPPPAFGPSDSGSSQYASHNPILPGALDPTSYFGRTMRHAGPFTPVDQITHTPDQPPELLRPAKRLPFHRRNVLDPYGRHLSAPPSASYGLVSPGVSMHSVPPESYRPQPPPSASSSAFSHYQSCYSSPCESPSFSPYPSPIGSPLLRSTSRMACDNHQQWTERQAHSHAYYPVVRRLSYQYPPRQELLSSVPSSRNNPSHSQFFEDHVNQSLENLELASPVAIRPLFSALTPSSSVDSSLGSVAGTLEEDDDSSIKSETRGQENVQ
ncbi:hypothetical protein OF83DRAFT_1282753 [Amylostereum chailletii]|nr:hypothetical protein OF83DRAFT_1282753 [Amylostereum chailletii]